MSDATCSLNRGKAVRIAFGCFLKRLPLFVSRTPGTPLRVLCVIAVDVVRQLQNNAPLCRRQVSLLSRSLKLAARANAILDGKSNRAESFTELHHDMHAIGIGPLADRYLSELRQLEHRRPRPNATAWQTVAADGAVVRQYREDVVRLSLSFALAVTDPTRSLDDCQQAIQNDSCLAELFRICMLCQIIDDMLDYAKDQIAGLPTFLTIPMSLPNAIALTGASVKTYSPRIDPHATAATGLFRIARRTIAATASFLIILCRLRHGRPPLPRVDYHQAHVS